MMNAANKIISVYTGDVSGVCSALYELDGMSVMHDASGCNSTYNTHDEPRWYDKPSRVYISALTEYDAILGKERTLIDDCVNAARDLKPRFIALAPSPIACVMGQDIQAVGKIIEKESGVPVISVETNGMHSYIAGVSEALVGYAKRFVNSQLIKKNDNLTINLLGATPLDFGNAENVEDLKNSFEKEGFYVNSVWAMNSSIEAIDNSASSDVNVVLSSTGLNLAKYFENKFSIPYVVGLPWGEKALKRLSSMIKTATLGGNLLNYKNSKNGDIAIIGEPVQSASLSYLIDKQSQNISLLSKLTEDDIYALGEENLEESLKGFSMVIADPLFKPLVSQDCNFIEFPHFAFSGRIYKEEIISLADDKGDAWLKRNNL